LGVDPLGVNALVSGLLSNGAIHDGHRVHGGRRRVLRGVRPLCLFAEARLTMVVTVLYAAGAVVVTVYMLAALLRPDKF